MKGILLIRRIVQLLSVIVLNSYFKVIATKEIYGGFLKGICVPILHCYACPLAFFSCPIGTIQHYITIRRFPMLDIGYLLLAVAFVGRAPCGWLCPFGFFQGLLYGIKTVKFKLPRYMDNLKYVVLVVLVGLIPYYTKATWFCKLCPAGALEATVPWALWNPKIPGQSVNIIDFSTVGFMFYLKIAILVIFIVWAIFTYRPFCRAFCPLGAILGMFNRFSFLQLRVDDVCRKCGACEKVCPVDLRVYEEANSSSCIRCLSCVKSCKSVQLQFAGKDLLFLKDVKKKDSVKKIEK